MALVVHRESQNPFCFDVKITSHDNDNEWLWDTQNMILDSTEKLDKSIHHYDHAEGFLHMKSKFSNANCIWLHHWSWWWSSLSSSWLENGWVKVHFLNDDQGRETFWIANRDVPVV
jgi:hypothetical protein